jgi:hypothetical protein
MESSGVSTPYSDRYSIPAILVIGGSAIVLMYARRRVWFARLLLLSLPGIIAVVAIYLPNGAMVESAYPREKGMMALADVPIQFQFHTDSASQAEVTADSRSGSVEVRIPLEATGVAAGHVVTVDDVMAVMRDGHGTARTAPWTAVYNHYYLRGDWLTSVELKMKRADYEAVQGRPLTLELWLAMTEAQTKGVSRIALPMHDFEVPEFGNCAGAAGMSAMLTSLGCWTALHGPPLTYVKANLASAPCGQAPHDPAPEEAGKASEKNTGPDAEGMHATAWVGSLEHDPADFGLTSVWNTSVSLSEGGYYRTKYLCPGSVVSFTRFGLVRRLRTVVTIPNFQMPLESKGRFEE